MGEGRGAFPRTTDVLAAVADDLGTSSPSGWPRPYPCYRWPLDTPEVCKPPCKHETTQ